MYLHEYFMHAYMRACVHVCKQLTHTQTHTLSHTHSPRSQEDEDISGERRGVCICRGVGGFHTLYERARQPHRAMGTRHQSRRSFGYHGLERGPGRYDEFLMNFCWYTFTVVAPITMNVMSYHDMAMHQSLSLMTHCQIIPVVLSLTRTAPCTPWQGSRTPHGSPPTCPPSSPLTLPPTFDAREPVVFMAARGGSVLAA